MMADTLTWSLEIDADRIAWLVCDTPGASTNVLSAPVLRDLATQLEEIAAKPPAGVVIRSAKTSGFIAGADIKEFLKIRTPEEGYELVRAGQTVLQALEYLPCPSVAALHGFALGGGLEHAPIESAQTMPSCRWVCPRYCSASIPDSAARCAPSGSSACGRPLI
jgi:enoyl-CoA hydratase/carnithine racemase